MNLNGIMVGSAVDTERALAKDRLASRAVDIQEQGLALKQQKLDLEQNSLQAKHRAEIRKVYTDTIDKMISDLPEVIQHPKSMEEIKKIRGVIIGLGRIMSATDTNGEVIDPASASLAVAGLQRFDAKVSEIQTANEKAASEAKAAGQKAGAVAKAKKEAVPEEPKAVTFYDPRKKGFTSVDVTAPDATKKVQDIIDAGGFRATAGVQATSTGELSLTGETPKTVQAVRDKLRTTASALEELSKTAKAFAATPQAGGMLGLGIEKIGGVAEQIPFLKGLTKAITGVSPKEVQDVRTQARITTAQMLTTITQEKGRFSDQDRQRAEAALQTLSVTASPEQIAAALRTAMDVMQRTEIREMDRLRIAGNVDLSTKEGVNMMGEILMKNGYTHETAVAAVGRLLDRLGL